MIMKLSDVQNEFTFLLATFILWCKAQGYKIVLVDTYRDPQWQKILLDRGRSKTLHSKHCDKLAADIVLFDGDELADPEKYKPLGEYWKSLDYRCVWGGDWTSFPDANHFQLTK